VYAAALEASAADAFEAAAASWTVAFPAAAAAIDAASMSHVRSSGGSTGAAGAASAASAVRPAAAGSTARAGVVAAAPDAVAVADAAADEGGELVALALGAPDTLELPLALVDAAIEPGAEGGTDAVAAMLLLALGAPDTLELPLALVDAAIEPGAEGGTDAVAAMLLLALALAPPEGEHVPDCDAVASRLGDTDELLLTDVVADGTGERESVAVRLLLGVGTLAVCDAVAMELCVLEREEVPLTDPAASQERTGGKECMRRQGCRAAGKNRE